MEEASAMSEILLTQRGNARLDATTLQQMFRLRHTVFHDRLGWEVPSDNGMEHDEFDNANSVYVLARGTNKEVVGCTRLLPTNGPYMLKDTFPQLLAGQPAPQQADVWEFSRFALAEGMSDSRGFGLSSIPVHMIRAAVRFAKKNGIRRYVYVTSVAFERMLRKLGVHIERLGPPIRIGRVLTVACTLEIDAITEFALFGTLPEHAPRKVA
jgi:acyl homoserine lactone synthase